MISESLTPHQPRIEPPEGAPIRAPFGVLKTARGLQLVRLEDVHAWMMQREGLPSASAVARVFGAFSSDANSADGMERGAAKVREFLHLTDLSGHAEPVSEFAGRHFLRKVARLVPYVPHHRFERGTPEALMYSLGLVAGEVWAPHAVDIDLNERLEEYMPDGEFPTVAKAREIVGRLAVPYAAARALWGWGSVRAVDAAAPTPLSLVRNVPDQPPTQSPAPADKLPQKSRAPQWTGEALAEKREKLKLADPKRRDYTQQLAALTGLTPREITRREKQARDSAALAKLAATRTSGKAA